MARVIKSGNVWSLKFPAKWPNDVGDLELPILFDPRGNGAVGVVNIERDV
jgi:hypothetical protein